MITESTISCPACATSKTETMPTDACQFLYECTTCRTMLRPKPGDCCVFGTYGSILCSAIQAAGRRENRSDKREAMSLKPGPRLGL